MQPPAPPSFAPPGLSAAPGPLPPISQLLADAAPPPPAWLPSSLHGPYLHASRLPIVDYYRYLLHASPALLGCTLAVNWLLPVLLEALPWYLSRRQLSKLLRDSRNAIQHRLISSDPLSSSSLLAFGLMSVMYSVLHSAEEMLRSRLMLLNRLQVRRMLIERILFSEVGSLQSRYALSFGGGDAAMLRTEMLEAAVFNDMNDTLQLFNSTLPAMFRSAYSLSLSGSELYRQRHSIHLLSILRPSVIALASEAVSLLHSRLVLDTQSLLLLRNANAGSRLVSNIVDGLGEIQVSNGQDWQLQRLDRVSREEADGKQGLTTFLSSTLHSLQGRGVLDFVSEVAVVKAVMESSGLSHEQYRAVQNDIEYVGRLIGRLYSLSRDAARTLDSQHRVMAVLNLPTFRHEAAMAGSSRLQQAAAEKPPDEQRQEQATAAGEAAAQGPEAAAAAAPDGDFHFEELVVRRLWFRYGEKEPWALRIGSPPALARLDRKEQRDDDDDTARDAVDSRDGRREEHRAAEEHSEQAALSGSLSQRESPRSASATGSRSSSSPPVLRFQRGRTYAIIGQNRSGKSTLVQILCKLRAPLPDTEPLIDINPSASSCPSFLSLPRVQLRSVLSYIPQRPFIFPGTIEDNVRMANTRASRQEVEDAARRGGVFLFDRQAVADDDAKRLQTAEDSRLQRRDVTVRKPWEVNRLTDTASRVWRWLQAVWDWSRPEEGGELDDDDDVDDAPLPLQPLLMEDEMMGERRPPLTASQPLPPPQPPLPDAARLLSLTAPAPISLTTASPAPSLTARTEAAAQSPPRPAALRSAQPACSPSSSCCESASCLSSCACGHSGVLSLETAEGGSNLSGGFAQSVALSRVFLRGGTELLILDESMSSMDPIKTREHIVPQLLQWVRERRQCLLLVTHDVRLICPLVDCVYVMEAGRLRQSGSHAQLWHSRAQPYCRMYGEQ